MAAIARRVRAIVMCRGGRVTGRKVERSRFRALNQAGARARVGQLPSGSNEFVKLRADIDLRPDLAAEKACSHNARFVRPTTTAWAAKRAISAPDHMFACAHFAIAGDD